MVSLRKLRCFWPDETDVYALGTDVYVRLPKLVSVLADWSACRGCVLHANLKFVVQGTNLEGIEL